MKKNKKKLPRFWLGTRMPNSLGYQPNYGIGGYLYTSTPGESVLPEVNTIKSNTIPGVLNKLQTNSSFAINALKDIANPVIQGSTAALKSASTFGANSAALGVRDVSNTVNNINSIGKKGLEQATHRAGLGTLGTVTAGIGTLYGGIDMGMQIAANKDHRTAADMRNTLTTNTYTTDLGNTYTTHGGVDKAAELDYAKKQKLAKNLNFTATSIGTGMSAGALAGSLIGSLAPGLGTAIGAGVGALGGGIAYLAGFGDTEAETKAAMDRLTDVTSMEDKMSYSLALNKDAQQGFYGRTKSGSLPAAACGKQPGKKLKGYSKGTPIDPNKKQWVVTPEGPVFDKPDSLGSSGETAVRTDKNGNVISAFVLPGFPNNNDTIPMKIGNGKGRKLENGMPPGSQNVAIMTNQHGISDIAQLEIKNSGNINGALALQDILMNNGNTYMMNGRNTDLLFLAKCGKLPKYSGGTPTYGGWGDYILTAMPNMAALYSAWDQLQTDKHMPVEAPNRQIDLSGARNALYRMYGDLIDTRPYMNAIDLDTSRAIYRALRNPGAGYGGRMVLENAITSNAIAEKARQRYAIDQANLQQRNTVNQALAALDLQQLAWENDNFWKSTSLRQAAQAAKYKALAQDKLNLVNPLAQMTKGILDMRQFNVANNIKNRMIDIYDRSTDLETQRFLAEKASNDALLENTKHKKIAEAYAKMASNPKIALYLPYLNWMGWRPKV